MDVEDAVRCRRLLSLGLAEPLSRRPWEPLGLLGGVQAQDYKGARWAIGLRTAGCLDVDVEAAVAGRRIVRTWAFRGTLHLLAAEDVRWVAALLAPTIVASNSRRYGQLELDERAFAKSRGIIRRALAGAPGLTRAELVRALESRRLPAGGQRAPYLLQRAALDGVICQGPLSGREPVYVLLDEWVPAAGKAAGDGAALEELARRYFASHGPASLRDFAWWSGLPAAEARQATESASPALERLEVSGSELWAMPRRPSSGRAPAAVLLPAFDELLLGYQDRELWLDPRHARSVNAGGGMPRPAVLLNGRVAGTWSRQVTARGLQVAVRLFATPRRSQVEAIQGAAARLAAFLGVEALPAAVSA